MTARLDGAVSRGAAGGHAITAAETADGVGQRPIDLVHRTLVYLFKIPNLHGGPKNAAIILCAVSMMQHKLAAKHAA